MPTNHVFIRNETLPSYWPNALSEFVGAAAHGFELSLLNPTTVRVAAGPGNGQASIAIEGRWRRVAANVDRVHPGGGAGVYDIYVVAAENAISNSPLPFTDNTNYAFDLRIVPAGSTPPLSAGVVDVFRMVGSLAWSGAAITSVAQLVGRVNGERITDGVITDAKVAGGAAIAESKLALASDAAAATASRRTLGNGATQAAPGAAPAWITFPFGAGWGFPGGFATPQYRKNQLAEVVLRGTGQFTYAAGTTSVVGTLPAGFRPAADTMYFPARWINQTTQVLAVADLQIDTSGAITVRWPSGAIVAGEIMRISLASIRFTTD